MSSDFEPRRAKPGQTFTVTTGSDGEQHELKADKDGVVHPTSAADVALLDTFRLPVARSAMRAEAAATDDTDDAVVETGPDTKGGKG